MNTNYTSFSKPSIKASNGSSDESDSPSDDGLLEGLSGAGIYSRRECCCSSSSSKYLQDVANSVKKQIKPYPLISEIHSFLGNRTEEGFCYF